MDYLNLPLVYIKLQKLQNHVKYKCKQITNLHIKNRNIKIINKIKYILTLDPTIFPNLNCEDVELLEVHHIKLD